MMRRITLFKLFLFQLLAACALFGIGCTADAARQLFIRESLIVLLLSLLATVLLSIVRLVYALIRKELSYEAHGSALAVTLLAIALFILGSIGFGSIY